MSIDLNNLSGTAAMTFDEEFNNLSIWNGTTGTWDTNYWYNPVNGNGGTLASNGEQEWYINANDPQTSSVQPWTVNNGELTIQAQPASPAISSLINGYEYTSGMLNTYYSFSQTYGVFEARMKLPEGQGFWPAFWLMPENGSWPPELDVMENLGNNPNDYYTTVHSTTLSGWQESSEIPVTNPGGWNTYAVDWEPDYTTFYEDGKEVYQVKTPSDMNSPMYMLLNLAVGGNWPGDVNASTDFNQTMQVDWVRAYQSLPSDTGTSTTTSTGTSTTTSSTSTTSTTTSTTGAASASPPTAPDPVPGDHSGAGETLAASGSAVALTGVSGWTSAAVLSNGEVVVVGGPGASGVGSAETFDASGHATGASNLQAFEGVSPTVTALAGGFYEVTYANSSDFEVYNSNDQLVFQHNMWSPAGQVFTPLQNGDDLITAQGSNSVALVHASGAVDWLSLPSDAPSGATTAVTALEPGGFALTYAGTAHFDVFNAAGQQTGSGDLGASMSSFATATTATSNGGFAEVWLSADGGQNGLPSSLDVQAFDASGKPTSGVITLTQDLDPWHTQVQLASHADGSLAAFWSQGGQIWSSEITGGVAEAAQATGVTGSLSDAHLIALSNGESGFVFQAYGEAWAEIWNPATGTKTVADLGAATGDGSTLHAVATTTGGFAVSWHDGATIEASIMSANGQASAPITLSGDLMGVNASGQAVTVYDHGDGTPVMQTYALSDGSFWHY